MRSEYTANQQLSARTPASWTKPAPRRHVPKQQQASLISRLIGLFTS